MIKTLNNQTNRQYDYIPTKQKRLQSYQINNIME